MPRKNKFSYRKLGILVSFFFELAWKHRAKERVPDDAGRGPRGGVRGAEGELLHGELRRREDLGKRLSKFLKV